MCWRSLRPVTLLNTQLTSVSIPRPMVECRCSSTSEVVMSLNIKNEEIHRRARELARLAGESMTGAVDRAITERLDRIRAKRNRADRVARILQIGRECAALPVLDRRTAEDMLFDEHGLPR
jgi:antitoxin VapB